MTLELWLAVIAMWIGVIVAYISIGLLCLLLMTTIAYPFHFAYKFIRKKLAEKT